MHGYLDCSIPAASALAITSYRTVIYRAILTRNHNSGGVRDRKRHRLGGARRQHCTGPKAHLFASPGPKPGLKVDHGGPAWLFAADLTPCADQHLQKLQFWHSAIRSGVWDRYAVKQGYCSRNDHADEMPQVGAIRQTSATCRCLGFEVQRCFAGF